MDITDSSASPGESRRLLLFVAAFYALWTARAFALAPLDRGIRPALLRQFYLDGIRLCLWIVPVVLYVKLVDRGVVPRALKLNTPVRRTGLLRSGAASVVFLAGALMIGSASSGRRIASPLEVSPNTVELRADVHQSPTEE